MSAAASWRREKEAITYQYSVVSCRLRVACFGSHVHVPYFHTYSQCCPYDQRSHSPAVNSIPHPHGCKVHHPTASHFTGLAAMPVVGLGVYQNPSCKPACLAALECGYRSVTVSLTNARLSNNCSFLTYRSDPQAYRLCTFIQE